MPIHIPPDGRDGGADSARRRVAHPSGPARLSRRDFLAGAALAGVGAFAAPGCSRRAGACGNPGGWYAWLSDIHLAADPSATVQGQVMARNLSAVVAEILDATDPPRGVLIDGDLAMKDGRPGDYRALMAATAPLRHAGIPLHLAMGNHDDRETFREVLGDLAGPSSPVVARQVGEVDGPGHRVLLLDSMRGVNVTPGDLGPGQLAWLAERLDAAPDLPTILFVHHNLNARSQSALSDTAALMEVLRPRPQAKAVVYGHTHVWHAGGLDGLHAINLPAVGYSFQPRQPLGWCVFRPFPDGGELELRCIGGDRRQDRRRVPLRWRTA